MRALEVVGLVAAVASFSCAQRPPTYDLVVYGGTSAGVIAAVQAQRMGKSVIIVWPDKHLGGLSSGGLGFTDTGNKAVIGGLSREFYHRVWQHYQQPDAWHWQKREEYGNKGQGTPAIDGEQRTMWIFEPHVAEQVFEELVREHHIPVHRNEWLNRSHGVNKDGGRITSIRMLYGRTYAGKMFIDATYEGDLMAAAGVDYHVGREARTPTTRSGTACRRACCTIGTTLGTEDDGSPVRRAGRSQERCSAAHQHQAAGRIRRRRQADPGLLLSHVPDQSSRQSHSVSEAGWLRPEAVRTARPRSSTQAGGKRSTSSIPFPTARPTRNNHGPFSTDNIGLQLRLPGSVLRAPARDPEGARDLPEGLALFHRQRSARPDRCADGDAPLGTAEGRVQGQRRTGRTRFTSAKRAG